MRLAILIITWVFSAHAQVAVMATQFVGEQNSLMAIASHLGHATLVHSLAELPATPSIILHSLDDAAEVAELSAYKRAHPSVRLVNLGDPGREARASFDLVLTFAHMPHVPGAVVVEGVPSQVSAERLAPFEDGSPITAVLIGGNADGTVFTPEDARALASRLNSLPGRIVATNSRRTPPDALAAFLSVYRGEFHDWQTPGGRLLPLLARAHLVVVTGDSMSMIADALKTGKPTYAFAPATLLEPKHRAFIDQQVRAGRLRVLGDTPVTAYTYPPLDTAAAMAREIDLRFGLRCESVFGRR